MARKEGYSSTGIKDGCHAHPSCFTCPLARCVFENSSVSVGETARTLAQAGVDDATISQRLYISLETLQRWRSKGRLP
jgi:transposase-like protein